MLRLSEAWRHYNCSVLVPATDDREDIGAIETPVGGQSMSVTNESNPAGPSPEILGGRYVLSADARTGAQASVVQAYDTIGRRLVAVKRVKAGPDDERARAGLQLEFGILKSLEHPNIVALLEVDRDAQGDWYLVLEWVPETLDDVVRREGPMAWSQFWDRIGHPLLDAVAFAQKKQIAHRDIKPKNILITETGTPKLADYGIAKLVHSIDAWAPASGYTFRFDHTPGYTPSAPDSPEYSLSRDCFGFAAVAVACVSGRLLASDEDRAAALQEAVFPANIRAILDRSLSPDVSNRPRLASILQAQIERAQSDNARSADDGLLRHLLLSTTVKRKLERSLEIEGAHAVERFILEEFGEACALLLVDESLPIEAQTVFDLVGVTWRFRAARCGKHGASIDLTSASDIGAALASDLRERSVRRNLAFTFDPPRDVERTGQNLSLLLAEAVEYQREQTAARQAQASQRVFRVWRSYLRDRADLEAKRANAITFVNRQVVGDSVVFTTELAQNEDIVGQERVVTFQGGSLAGRISNAIFNQVTLDVSYGDAAKVPRRGEMAINTLAAQRALDHQSFALNAILYDRAVSSKLKPILLEPRNAAPIIPILEVQPTDDDFDEEKRIILSQALGVQDVLAIEGPPGTGKTKLITEIVVQWLSRNPGHRILLSSQTHIALDNVLERVGELNAGLDMIRIGRPDEPRISPFSKKLLLEHRVDAWIAEVRKNAESDMQRWADENGVDRDAVAVGMKVERLLQVLEKKREMREFIAGQEVERQDVEGLAEASADAVDIGEIDEETTQIDSEIGACRLALKAMTQEEKKLRSDLSTMGVYAAALSISNNSAEMAEWASHFLTDEPTINACRERLGLLEAWQLRVGRSPDFNAAMLASAQIIAGTCVGIAGVRGMDDVAYDLCIIDEASKATATEMLIPMSRSRRWIIVGDPEQLPPFFEEFGEQIQRDFPGEEIRATLLDRFLDKQDGLPEACRAKLKNQYRMIKPIGDLISECFYDRDLHSPKATHGLKLSAAVPRAVTWYSTHRLPERSERPEGKTFSNATEVSAVGAVLRRLQFVAKGQKRRISIAVIAGYTAQVQALADMASQCVAEWPDLEVTCNSVDAFQGRQADVCIYSVVRSNTRSDLGFLREKPRLNVALSRGKSALVIVGDYPFCQNAGGENPFKAVTKYIEEHEADCAIEALS